MMSFGSAGQKSGFESLGTVFYEPLWWLHRRDVQGEGVPSLLGRKISIGPEGSGTRALALELIKAAGIEHRVELLPLAPRESADRLLAGEIDVAFMMTSWESPVVRQLLADERVELSGFPRAALRWQLRNQATSSASAATAASCPA
jgi:TRAP-type uncharacterized transport system substrate-binding protein